jgi:predicted ArsR family transcriptional regulator
LTTELSQRFWETTRGRVIGLLRRGPRTVEEVAAELGLTDNAIRVHLATLERDGLVRQEGIRRGAGAGKPASVYALGPEVAVRLSRAYAPVLTALLEELAGRLGTGQVDPLMLATGRRLGASLPHRTGSLEQRVRGAATLLNELGGDTAVLTDPSGYRIQSSGCPLSAAVARHPETCRAMQGLLAEMIGSPVTQCCEQGPNPRCCFAISSAA